MANTVETSFKISGVQDALKQIAEYKKSLQGISAADAKNLISSEKVKRALLQTEKEALTLAQKKINLDNTALSSEQKKLSIEKELLNIEQKKLRLYEANARIQERANRALQRAANPQQSGIRGQVGSALSDLGLNNLGSLASAATPLAGAGVAFALTTGAINKAIDLTQTAIEKTNNASRANRLLSASATEAGKSYAFLAEKNLKFAESVGLSATAASATTAKITQLAAFSGDTSEKNIDRLLKSFANLGAARGIDSKDLETLIGTILSGQDEGLNRLGIADPSKLYEAYAKSIGTTADKLNQFQKVQAAANAVVEKAGLFAGAADARMKSLEGATSRSTAAWENFTTALSKSFTENAGLAGFLNRIASSLKSLTAETDALQKKISEGNLKPSDIDAASNDGTLKRLGSKALGLAGLATLFTPQGQLFNLLSQGKFRENAGLFFNSDINADINKQQVQQQINAQILADAQQKKAAADAERELRQKITDDALKNNQNQLLQATKNRQAEITAATDAFYALQEARLKSHLDTTKTEELKTLREVGQLRLNQIQQQIADTENNFKVLLSTQALSAKEQTELRSQTNIELTKLSSQYAIAEIENQKLIAQKEREIQEERIKKEKERVDKLKASLKEVRDTIFNANAISTQNPYVTIFSNAAKEIERVRELVKDLNGNVQQAALRAVQNASAAGLFGQRIDTSLEVSDLRQQAQNILRPPAPSSALLKNADGGILSPLRQYYESGGGDYGLALAQKALARNQNPNLTDEQFDQQQQLRRAVQAILQANTAGIDPAIVEQVRDGKLANLFRNVDPASVPKDLQSLAANALDREAARRERQEIEALKFYESVTSLISSQGIKVDFGNQTPFQIEIKGGNLVVSNQPRALPSR